MTVLQKLAALLEHIANQPEGEWDNSYEPSRFPPNIDSEAELRSLSKELSDQGLVIRNAYSNGSFNLRITTRGRIVAGQ